MKHRLIPFHLVLGALLWANAARAQTPVSVIAPHDTVTMTVDGQSSPGGQYFVEADGSLDLPLIGRIAAAGLTADSLSEALARRLGAYIKEPRVHVAVQRFELVFIFGDVKRPGTYVLTRNMTVLELLIAAQYNGVSEVLLVRAQNGFGPILPEHTSSSDVIHVNLRNLEHELATGNLSRNLLLRPRDTVFVPHLDANAVSVAGRVRNPGSYSVFDGTTVRQMLALAGGATANASLNRLRIVRIASDKQVKVGLRLDDPVQPGDTIVVPESFRFPSPGLPIHFGSLSPRGDTYESVSFDPLGRDRSGESSAREPGQIRLGSVVTFTPLLSLTRFGVDSNVFNNAHDPKAAFVAELTPGAHTRVDMRRARFDVHSALGFAYYRGYTDENSINPEYGVAASVAVAKGVALAVGHEVRSLKDRLNGTFDPRVRHNDREYTAGVVLGPWRHVRFDVGGSDLKRSVGEELAPLSEATRSVTARGIIAVSPSTSVFASGATTEYRFPLFQARDADAIEVLSGASFKRSAAMEGRAQIGLLRYRPFDPSVPRTDAITGGGMLWHTWRDRAQVGVRGERSAGAAYQTQFAYAMVTGYGGWIQVALPPALDVVAETYHEDYAYRAFGQAIDPARSHLPIQQTIRYTSQVAVHIKSARVGLEVSYLQRLGVANPDPLTQNYSGWRTNIIYEISHRMFDMRRNDGTSIRGRNGFTNF